MEIKINKEIREYKENIYFGLNLRQFVFSLMGIVVGTLLFLLLRNKLSMEVLSWVCILAVIPFGLFGFIKYNGMHMEQLLIALIKSEILIPKHLFYEPTNFYKELLRGESYNENKEK